MIKRLKFLGVEHDKKLTELFVEAINDLFAKYEKTAQEVKRDKADRDADGRHQRQFTFDR